MNERRVGWATVLLVAAALLAAACGSDDDGDPTSTPTTSHDEFSESTTTATPDGGQTTETPELTASFRGVTAESIAVGVVAIDYVRLAEFGIDLNRGDGRAMFEAAVEAINDRGGIHGRRLDIVTEAYLPVGSIEADEICVRLTEDRESFIVVGEFRLDEALCYTALNDTAVVALSEQNQDRIDRSTAPYVSVAGQIEADAQIWVDTVVASGALDGKKVGVIGFASVDEALYLAMVAALQNAGIDTFARLVDANDNDINQSVASAELVFELFRVEGVEVTINANVLPGPIGTAAEQGYSTTWMQIPYLSPAAFSNAEIDFDYLDGMLAVTPTPVGTTDQRAVMDDPLMVDCVEMIESRTDEVIDFALHPEVRNLFSAMDACALATVLELGLTAAGPELTNETLAAGFESLGEFPLAGYFSADLGPGDQGAINPSQIVRFSADEGAWVPVE
ncbi:MAG: hypothetical protein DHS20C19_10240 [Acidimicrobiales bacterium]|nr:MAG: hypothetical protein DHS20C19_10240 [Acidimicrobiales bacterium]